VSTRVLVLGAGGMLGHQVLKTLSADSSLTARGTYRTSSGELPALDAEQFLRSPSAYDFIREYDFIINCIGVIKPYCRDNDPSGALRAVQINGVFPRQLAEYLRNADARVIQIATDCVYSGKTGFYNETAPHDAWDIYGKSKSLGEVIDEKFIHFRSSIIGRELSSRVSLLEWFLAQPENSEVLGFDHHLWNGVTTLQFAELCAAVIRTGSFDHLRKRSHCHHFVPNEVVTKCQLLEYFRAVFEKKLRIRRILEEGSSVNRTLSSVYTDLSELIPPSRMLDEIMRIAVRRA
jgi:dTDP-4-dehydrorhamnose reductase